MRKLVLSADSGVDPKYGIIMVPGRINNEKESLRDVIDIDPDKIVYSNKEYMTSSPTGEDFENAIKDEVEKSNDVIHLTMSSGISEGSLRIAENYARLSNELNEGSVEVIDSLTGAAGGLELTLYADDLINKYQDEYKKGTISKEDMVNAIKELRNNLLSSFYVPDASGFIRSGRNKTPKQLMAKFALNKLKSFNIKTRVDFNNEGNLNFKGLYRGKNQKQFIKYLKDINENKELYDQKYIALLHMPYEDINEEDIIDDIDYLGYYENIVIQKFNGVYTSYGCPDLMSVGLMNKESLDKANKILSKKLD